MQREIIQEDSLIIQLENVGKKYDAGGQEFWALRNINLKIHQGEFVAVVGKSGSGKSTLLNLLGGIDSPTTGTVQIHDEIINRYNENQLGVFRGKHIGIIFQFFQLMPTLTVLENVIMPMDFTNLVPKSKRQEKAKSLLEKVGLENHAQKYPAALSGGEQQRAAIARALANDPELIFADEPTGNLDTNTTEQIFALLKSVSDEGKTFVLVTHNNELAERCSRIICMKDGKISSDTFGETGAAL